MEVVALARTFRCVTCREERRGLAIPMIWEGTACGACAGPNAGPGAISLRPFVCDGCRQERTGRRYAALLSLPHCQPCYTNFERDIEAITGSRR